MANQRRRALTTWIGPLLGLVVSGAALLIPGVALAQGLTGALIGTVKDADGGVLPGATVRVSSPALIGGPRTLTTNENGQLRFPTLPPGLYVLDIELAGFASSHEADIPIGAGATIERTVPLSSGGRRGFGRGPGHRLAHRRAQQRVRDARGPRGPHRHPLATVERL